jgi:putative ABC transport system ATP-binding protein
VNAIEQNIETQDHGSAAPVARDLYDVRSVSKEYQLRGRTVHALQDVSLRIDDGDFLAIQGPTGSGKSTLLQLLGALDPPTSGSVSLEGRDLGRMREGELADLRSRALGFIFQEFNLIPTLTAVENVEMALVPLRVRGRTRRQRALDALDSVGLGPRSSHIPAQLSGGEQQRVGIARALVREPRVILADEPTGNLDEGTRDEIIEMLERLWRDRGQTIVLVTHDSQVARRASRRLNLKSGRVAK